MCLLICAPVVSRVLASLASAPAPIAHIAASAGAHAGPMHAHEGHGHGGDRATTEATGHGAHAGRVQAGHDGGEAARAGEPADPHAGHATAAECEHCLIAARLALPLVATFPMRAPARAAFRASRGAVAPRRAAVGSTLGARGPPAPALP